PGANLLA
ncbi:glutamate decarboxylase, partial [Escherichia coli EC1869]